jgi:hypothetical protein
MCDVNANPSPPKLLRCIDSGAANDCKVVVSEQSVFIAYGRKGEAPRIRRAHFITQIYHTKPRSRKEEEKEIVFFPSFAPSRLCVIKT